MLLIENFLFSFISVYIFYLLLLLFILRTVYPKPCLDKLLLISPRFEHQSKLERAETHAVCASIKFKAGITPSSKPKFARRKFSSAFFPYYGKKRSTFCPLHSLYKRIDLPATRSFSRASCHSSVFMRVSAFAELRL